MLWCYSDYSSDIWTEPPLDEAVHERHFGLWRADASAKPALEAIAAFARASRLAVPGDGWIDIDQDRYWERPGEELPRLYRRYRDRAATPSM